MTSEQLAVSVTGDQVLAWRLTRQQLDPVDGESAVEIARRLCGLQTQLPTVAALAVALRHAFPDLKAAPGPWPGAA